MATIRKPGTTHTPPTVDHIGEDKSFGRASVPSRPPRKSGLITHNARAEDELVVESDAVSVPRPDQAAGHKGH
jgi:hypothetical protein